MALATRAAMLVYWGLAVAAFGFWLAAIMNLVRVGAWVHLALVASIALVVTGLLFRPGATGRAAPRSRRGRDRPR